MLADIVSDTKEAVFLFDPEKKCIWVNGPGCKLTGTTENEFEKAGNMLSVIFKGIDNFPEDIEAEFVLEDGEEAQYYEVTRGFFNDDIGKKLGSYVRARNITSEKRRVEREIYTTKHDALTGVYTREYLIKKISDKLKHQNLTEYYLASIHICDFKMFNDVYGRDFGDYALTQLTGWIKKYSDENCIYGRLTGDTFGSCLPKNLFIPEKLEEDLSVFTVKRGDIEHHLVVHIGFYPIEEQDKDISIMFDRAFLALDSIRDNYKQHLAFFDKDLRDKMIWNQEISSQLGAAIRENQIFPYLQPIVDNTGKIVGAEALVRWVHPKQGFMSPGEFIPLFEENGMIVDLDKHIWRYACRLLSKWQKKHPDIFLSINVSPNDFYLTDVLADIRGLVREYNVEPKNLRIEVTETSMIRDTDEKMKVLEDFRKLGFIVEMDDFGSGYSSLNMLKDMPVDVLKIDMKFLGSSSDQERSDVIVKHVIQLSEDLGIVSLTEGIETKEQFDVLSQMGCVLFQGYYFSKPIPITEFESKLS